jgi:DNA-binding transcriptional regulator PaaX
MLASSPYRVRSSVRLDVFFQFIAAIEGTHVEVTNRNVSNLMHICDEFGFQSLLLKLSVFRISPHAKIRRTQKQEAEFGIESDLSFRRCKRTFAPPRKPRRIVFADTLSN